MRGGGEGQDGGEAAAGGAERGRPGLHAVLQAAVPARHNPLRPHVLPVVLPAVHGPLQQVRRARLRMQTCNLFVPGGFTHGYDVHAVVIVRMAPSKQTTQLSGGAVQVPGVPEGAAHWR